MLTLDEAREVLTRWNEEHFSQYVPMEVLDQIYFTERAWRISIRDHYPKAVILANLERHTEQLNRVPDELLLLLCDEADRCDDES